MVLLVISLDFGTSYSGWACSFRYEFLCDRKSVFAKHWAGSHMCTQKAPTCVLIEPDGKTFSAFGYEAETKYADLAADGAHADWYYFRCFKTLLYDKEELSRETTVEDVCGKPLPARYVFSSCIGYLKDDAMSTVTNRLSSRAVTSADIRWVLTVPTIWHDAAKQFMREAAEDKSMFYKISTCGIERKNLLLALEPEAASLFCRCLPAELCAGKSMSTFAPGTKYLVLDAGGGTVDITAHEVLDNGGLKEIHKAVGGAWGGDNVDRAYEAFLNKITGDTGLMQRLKDKYMDDYLDLFKDFEVKKREISKERAKFQFRMPSVIQELIREESKKSFDESIKNSCFRDCVTFVGGKIHVKGEQVLELFNNSVGSIAAHLQTLLELAELSDCKTIVMVGGFSESLVLQDVIKTKFPEHQVIVPQEAGLAVLKGAVIFGHDPTAIAQRILKFTYGQKTTHEFTEACLTSHPHSDRQRDENGIERCMNIFSAHARMGDTIQLDQEQSERVYRPISRDQRKIISPVLVSTEEAPQLTDGCIEIGKLVIDLSKSCVGKDRKFGVSFMFGETEVKVKVVNKVTGEIHITGVDCLD